jgi:probable F420-dependent oxidoreductase
VLVLTQRETCLVAKQAAEVDMLSGGRIRLGVGVGYNPIEFEALNADFKTRGKRFEEQIAVLRAFWTQEEVTFKGQWHNIRDASLSPSPGRTIPLWFGLGRRIAPYPPDAVLNRIGRLADGWLPLFKPGPEGETCKQKVHAAARAAGRDPAQIGMEMTLMVDPGNVARALDDARRYRDFGATHAMLRWESVSPADDIDMLKRTAGELISKFK